MKKLICLVVTTVLIFSLAGCSKVTLKEDSLEMYVGETCSINAESKDMPIVFTSSDTNVANVVGSGIIVATGVGTATITATNSKNATATCTVSVKDVQPTEIVLSESTFICDYGEVVKPEPSFVPSNTSDLELNWSSSDENIAKVSESGEITAVSSGVATIFATSSNGVSGSCIVKVRALADEVSINPPVNTYVGSQEQLSVNFSPECSSNESIEWSSSDEKIAKIEDGKLKCISAGSAIITAETSISHLKAEYAIDVDYPELTVSLESGGYSSYTMASINGYGVSTKSIGFNPSATASGGSGEYQYKFDIFSGSAQINTSGWQTSESGTKFSVYSGGTYTVTVTVKDSRGVTATASETVTLS